jgi:Flp pilus assembly protein TadD
VRALGQVLMQPSIDADRPRVTAAVVAHLIDPSRVVRVSAADALMAQGIVQLEDPAGAALRRAQDEWAESLRTFNDEPGDQATLGWLEAARGRTEAATSALRTAMTLDPTAPRPYVYLGVIAARSGRYDEAVRQFRAAKSLAPDYPNIDRLIEEAQKPR